MTIDWPTIEKLLAEGKSQRQVAAIVGCKPGTIAARQARKHQRSRSNAIAKSLLSASPSHRAALFLDAMSADCQATLARLQHGSPPRPGDYDRELKRETVLEKLNRRSRLTYGLDSEGGNTVRIGLSVTMTKGELESDPVIEVAQVADVADPPDNQVDPPKPAE